MRVTLNIDITMMNLSMPKTPSYLYSSDLERFAHRGITDEVSFKEQVNQLGKLTDTNSDSLMNFYKTSNVYRESPTAKIDIYKYPLNGMTRLNSLSHTTNKFTPSKLVGLHNNRLSDGFATSASKVNQTPSRQINRGGVEEAKIEGWDYIVFKITSDEVISKINELRHHSLPENDEWLLDVRVNKPLSIRVPIYTNTTLGYNPSIHLYELQNRLLLDYPSELVDVKTKVFRELRLILAPPLPYGTYSQEQVDEIVQDSDRFWTGIDMYSTIELISLKHDTIPSNVKSPADNTMNLPPRLVVDFVINNPKLANLVSSPDLSNRIYDPFMKILPDIPVHTELELRFPGFGYHAHDLEKTLLMSLGVITLGVPKEVLETLQESFYITSVDFMGSFA